MATVKLFFGSTNGNTERVAELIQDELGSVLNDMINISDASIDDFNSADKIILGLSTWQDASLQEDWEDFFPTLDEIDFSGKTVALFGLGDAYGYAGAFVNAMATLHHKVKEKGATIIGQWPTEEYDFEASEAVEGDHFIGLAIDEDNESDKTEDRVKAWVAMIKPQLA